MSQKRFHGMNRSSGFTLLEVMIAILVLGLGLLGFAMMQTMSVRFTESSNFRTKATNLAYDLTDQMRSNRLLAATYTTASFAATATGTDCPVKVGAVAVSEAISLWQCRVRAALGEGSSAVVVYNNGVASVTLEWDDQRWEKSTARKTGNYKTGTVTMSTRL